MGLMWILNKSNLRKKEGVKRSFERMVKSVLAPRHDVPGLSARMSRSIWTV